MIDMQKRVVDALEAIIAAHPDVEVPPEPAKEGEEKTVESGEKANAGDQKPEVKKRPQIVAIVAHADVIKAALAHYLDMPFDSFQKLGVAPASVSTVMVMTDDTTGKRHMMVNNVNHVPY
jgi:broad specificity phosphatase PhoE